VLQGSQRQGRGDVKFEGSRRGRQVEARPHLHRARERARRELAQAVSAGGIVVAAYDNERHRTGSMWKVGLRFVGERREWKDVWRGMFGEGVFVK
jgi:hypothetical protein